MGEFEPGHFLDRFWKIYSIMHMLIMQTFTAVGSHLYIQYVWDALIMTDLPSVELVSSSYEAWFEILLYINTHTLCLATQWSHICLWSHFFNKWNSDGIIVVPLHIVDCMGTYKISTHTLTHSIRVWTATPCTVTSTWCGIHVNNYNNKCMMIKI